MNGAVALTDNTSREALLAKIDELQSKLENAEQVLQAIRDDEVDAFVVAVHGRDEVVSLQGTEASYRHFVEVMHLAAATVQVDGTILYCNRHFSELFRVPLEKLVGSSVFRFVSTENEETLRTLLRDGMTTAYTAKDLRMEAADGRTVPVSLSAAPTIIAGERGVSLVASDMSEQEARLMVEAESKAKDHFIAVLSHELRTPLTPLVLALCAVEREPNLPPRCRGYLQMMRRNSEMMIRLIDDLLDVNRIANNKLSLQMENARVHSLLEAVSQMVASEIAVKRINLTKSLRASSDIVRGDPTRLQQVFWNLIKNAAKFTPEDGSITICSWNGQQEKTICVEVSDSGVGIAPASLAEIFKPFEQGAPSRTKQFGGLGLGLAISKGIVDAHGGTIRAQSDGEGKGARFMVELPCAGDSQQ